MRHDRLLASGIVWSSDVCSSDLAGAAGGGDIRGVQLAGHCKYAVGVCDDGDKAGGQHDGAAGAAG